MNMKLTKKLRQETRNRKQGNNRNKATFKLIFFLEITFF